MAQKLLIVLLVVVVVVFVVTLALGGSHAPRAPDDSDPDGISFLGGLRGNHFVHLGDKASTTCQNSDSVTLTVPASGCVIVVEKRSIFSRPTRVEFKSPADVTVSADANGVPSESKTVAAGKCYATAVDHKGGTITVIAPAFSTTTIALQSAPCHDDAGA